MSRKSKHNEKIELRRPNCMSRDELSVMSSAELASLRQVLQMELELVEEHSADDPRPWQEELCYVDRALEARRAYENSTPRSFWN